MKFRQILLLLLGRFIHTQFRESNQLAASLSGLIDPVNCASDRLLQVKPAGLSIDCCCFVLLENGRHFVEEFAVSRIEISGADK